MRCPFCNTDETRVIDSRAAGDGHSIRRRRRCDACSRRFTTYEKLEEIALYVIKKDGRREIFNREKIRSGLLTACKKRPIPMEKIEEITSRIEMEIGQRTESEVASKEIGDLVMRELHGLDHVAYVRFASVYREFKDVAEFLAELEAVTGKGKPKSRVAVVRR